MYLIKCVNKYVPPPPQKKGKFTAKLNIIQKRSKRTLLKFLTQNLTRYHDLSRSLQAETYGSTD